jgi:hypothetical protein
LCPGDFHRVSTPELIKLNKREGTHVPPIATGSVVKASFAISAPPPEPNCPNAIAVEAQEGDKVEVELSNRIKRRKRPPTRQVHPVGLLPMSFL